MNFTCHDSHHTVSKCFPTQYYYNLMSNHDDVDQHFCISYNLLTRLSKSLRFTLVGLEADLKDLTIQ